MQEARPRARHHRGHEADDSVEAEVDLGAGNAEAVVEQMGEDVEVFIAEEAAARAKASPRKCSAGRQDFGLFRREHSCLYLLVRLPHV